MQLRCPYCRSLVRLPDAMRRYFGMPVTCRDCRHAFVVPPQSPLHDAAIPADTVRPLDRSIVLVVGGRPDTDEEVDDATLDAMLHAEMDGQRLRDAVRAVVEATGLPRNRVYRAALALDVTNDRT